MLFKKRLAVLSFSANITEQFLTASMIYRGMVCVAVSSSTEGTKYILLLMILYKVK
jgi:hypothetical protein